MNDIQHIFTERVDDIPLLLEQMQRMELPTLIDQHFPAHGNWNSMIKFFTLDVSLAGGVAVSSGPALDSALAPSFLGRPSGQLPYLLL